MWIIFNPVLLSGTGSEWIPLIYYRPTATFFHHIAHKSVWLQVDAVGGLHYPYQDVCDLGSSTQWQIDLYCQSEVARLVGSVECSPRVEQRGQLIHVSAKWRIYTAVKGRWKAWCSQSPSQGNWSKQAGHTIILACHESGKNCSGYNNISTKITTENHVQCKNI